MTTMPIEPVEIAVNPATCLRGQLWAGGGQWLILLHDVGPDEDLDQWAPLVPLLTGQSWTVLAVDLRGHGASDGAWDVAFAAPDIAAWVEFARARGASFVGAIASGVSAASTLEATQATRFDALVLLSPSFEDGQPLTNLRGAGEAKLIIVGGGDPEARVRGERLCKVAIGWVALVNLPSSDQGTDLLDTPVAAHLSESVTGFLREHRYLAALRQSSLASLTKGSDRT
jgi:pimeloyl-ACP methyl ester carboxylesterase